MTFLWHHHFLDNNYPKRIYKIIFVIVITGSILSGNSYAQALEAYRTVASGNFDVPAIWEVYDGTNWQAATTKPGRENDVYIEHAYTVTLEAHEEVRNLYLNAETGAEQKIDMNGFELHLYGSLNAFEGAAPGSPSGSWNAVNWIGSSLDSRMVFKGDSRVVVEAASWSGFSTRSEYTVIFDPGPGVELTVEAPFKANQFILRSGKVIQKADTDGNCATFSFNTDPAYTGEYGALVIEEGATLASECSADITFRSATSSAALFELEEGGNLVLEGNDPEINAANVLLNGNVYYSSESGTQQFVTGPMPGATTSTNYHNLFFQNNGQKQLPENLYLTGDMVLVDGGAIQQDNTALFLQGNGDQVIGNLSLDLKHLEMDKASGIVTVDSDVKVKENFTFKAGNLDFGGHSLYLNTLGTGAYAYTSGVMDHLQEVHYQNIPMVLTSENGTFPFGDAYEGGIRKLQLLGAHGLADVDLSIRYEQTPGVDWDPDFLDNDGTPVIYQLYSLFSISGEGLGAEVLELRISADELIVDNVDDLRVVGDHEAAPGNHLPGLDDGNDLWARRQIDFSDLDANEFTIGSYRVATILPVTWLDFGAEERESDVLLYWTTGREKDNATFRIFRSVDHLATFDWVGEVPAKGDSHEKQEYQFNDVLLPAYKNIYYQIQQVDKMGTKTSSPVFKLAKHWKGHKGGLQIFPNPYHSGPIKVVLREDWKEEEGEILLRSSQGKVIMEAKGAFDEMVPSLRQRLGCLPTGFYLITLKSNQGVEVIKWIKR